MEIPIAKPTFHPQDSNRINDALDRGWVGMGPYTQAFEQSFAKFTNAEAAVSCSSGTTALHLALAAAKVGPGDEVIVPSFTWVASVNAVLYQGATPVLCDIDLDNYALSAKAFARAITARTKAVLPVHLFGCAAPMDDILTIAKERDIAVIEDAACALGTWIGGRHAGTIGDFGTFSFHPRKVITTGEGGMVLAALDAHLEQLRALRNHGIDGKGEIAELGFNYRLSDLQSAIGVGQMQLLPSFLARRTELAQRYSEVLSQEHALVIPTTPAGTTHSFQAYVCRLSDGNEARRNALIRALAAAGIQTRPGTHAVHRLGWHQENLSFSKSELSNAALAHDLTIALPLFPGMTQKEQTRVMETLIHTLHTL